MGFSSHRIDVSAHAQAPSRTGSLRLRQRLLDSIPGGLFWVVFGASLVSAVYAPEHLFRIGTALAVYSALRFLIAAAASLVGLGRIHAAQSVHWHNAYLRHPAPGRLAWEQVQHLVILPNYCEPLPILTATLERLASSEQAARMMIVLAMEEREAGATAKAEQLCTDFAGRFQSIGYSLHPAGLPGEIACKSSNQTWAVRWAVHHCLDVHHQAQMDHVVVTTMDADTLWHPAYFTALAYYFAVDPQRHHCFWQAPIRYHANVWDVHPFVRLINAYSSAFELAYLAGIGWQPLPISSYSLSLRLLHDCGYWDGDAIADDWHMYIKAYFARHSRLKVRPIFLPFLAYSTTGTTLWTTFKRRYEQTLRHAWGSKEIGYTAEQIAAARHIPLVASARLMLRVAHDLLFASSGWLVMTLGTQLPVLLDADLRRSLSAAPPELILLQCAVVVVAVLGVLIGLLDARIRPPRRRPATRSQQVVSLAGYALLPLLAAVFVTLPVIHAQTRLLIGLLLSFRVSPKL